METLDLLVGACLIGMISFCLGFFASQWAYRGLVNATQAVLDARTEQRDKAEAELAEVIINGKP